MIILYIHCIIHLIYISVHTFAPNSKKNTQVKAKNRIPLPVLNNQSLWDVHHLAHYSHPRWINETARSIHRPCQMVESKYVSPQGSSWLDNRGNILREDDGRRNPLRKI